MPSLSSAPPAMSKILGAAIPEASAMHPISTQPLAGRLMEILWYFP